MNNSKNRKAQMLDDELASIRVQTDGIFVALMLLQWIAGIGLALFVSPSAWEGSNRSIHSHVWIAALLGGLISSLPVAMAFLAPGRVMTRVVFAMAQMMWSGLLIHLTGGRIETHFHVFGSLALLAYYLDLKVLIAATVVTALDHLLRGFFMPESIYGLANPEWMRSIEHAGWVIFEDAFLLLSIRNTMKQITNGVEARIRNEIQIERSNEVAQLRKLELRATQAELAERNKMHEQHLASLQQSSQVKSEFLANMGHEIRTPMTAILGYADILADVGPSDPSRATEAITTIRRNGGHLLSIVDEILDLSKIESGRMELAQVDYSLRNLLTDVTEFMKGRAQMKSLNLTLGVDGAVPDMVVGDSARVRQVLVNLVGNAVKFTDSGSVTVQASYRENSMGSWVQLRVKDTGVGMTPEQVSKVFESFSTSDSSNSRCNEGTGLGLVISRRLVELMRGTVRVESQLGQGSTFIVDLPCSRSSTVVLPAARQVPVTRPIKDSTAVTPDIIHGARVLVVEDGIDNQRLMSFQLKKLGATVTLANNGQEGVDAILKCNPPGACFDVVFMDMQMPVLDGYSATTQLRQAGITLPIVAITAHAMEADRSRCLDAGCSDYVTKPMRKDDLRNALIAALSSSSPFANSTNLEPAMA